MLPIPTSYKDIVYARPDVEHLVDDLVVNRLPFPTRRKTGVLIWGSYGTGKTTLAKLLPGALNSYRGGSATVNFRHERIESGNNGPSLIVSLTNTVETLAVDADRQYIVLDEVDNLGPAAMKSLKNVMDGPLGVFIMTTNHLSKVDPAVISRSHLIDMTKPQASAWLPKVRKALDLAGVTAHLSDERLVKLIDLCGGDIGQIDTQLEQLRLDFLRLAIPSLLPPSTPNNGGADLPNPSAAKS